jgi:hypothetical protein
MVLIRREEETGAYQPCHQQWLAEFWACGGHPDQWSDYVDTRADGLMEVFAGEGPLGRHTAVQYQGSGMIPIEIRDSWVVIHAPQFLLVLSREQFIEALKHGNAWRRWQALEARQPRRKRGRL